MEAHDTTQTEGTRAQSEGQKHPRGGACACARACVGGGAEAPGRRAARAPQRRAAPSRAPPPPRPPPRRCAAAARAAAGSAARGEREYKHLTGGAEAPEGRGIITCISSGPPSAAPAPPGELSDRWESIPSAIARRLSDASTSVLAPFSASSAGRSSAPPMTSPHLSGSSVCSATAATPCGGGGGGIIGRKGGAKGHEHPEARV